MIVRTSPSGSWADEIPKVIICPVQGSPLEVPDFYRTPKSNFEPSKEKRFVINSTAQLLATHWGEAHFIFHSESGQTHFVNQLCAEVLALIEESGQTTEQIYQRILDKYEVDEDQAVILAAIAVAGLDHRRNPGCRRNPK